MSIEVHMLGAGRLLDVWDAARVQHPIDRALTIAQACTNLDRQVLARLSVGQRDALLVDVRRLLSGDRMTGICHCESCREANEFELDGTALPLPTPPQDGVVTVTVGDRSIRARLPNSLDLAAIAALTDEEQATTTILRRCLIDDCPLDDDITAALDRAMEQAEGIGGLEIAFSCSSCGTANRIPFDIAGFLWSEFAARAERLIADVDALASAYGWSETEILGLSDRRRALYVSRVRR